MVLMFVEVDGVSKCIKSWPVELRRVDGGGEQQENAAREICQTNKN